MKSLLKAFVLILGIQVLVTGCDNSDPNKVNVCLPTQFPLEEDGGNVTASYDSKNRISSLTYTYSDEEDVFRSLYEYDSKEKLNFIKFYINGYIADDFVTITYAIDTIRENYFRGNSLPENLTYYRKYYLIDNKISSFTEHDASNDFARGDSTVFEYTGNNVATIKYFNSEDILEATAELEFDSEISPYFKTGFSGSVYLYDFWNLSENNLTKFTLVELTESTTYTYTYGDNGYPLTRVSSAGIVTGEFIYNCDPG